MKFSKNLLIVLLCATATAAFFVAWSQYRRALAAEARAQSVGARAGLEFQLADSKDRIRDLETALEARGAEQRRTVPVSTVAVASRSNGPARGRDPREDFRAMMDRPEVQKLRALQQRASLDARYAGLFKQLKLAPGALGKFKDLLVEKDVTMQDTMMAAREQGIDPRRDPEGLRELIASAQSEMDTAIAAVLSSDEFSRYADYQQTQPQRALVAQLQQSLSYSNEPLSETQAEQMVRLLAASSPAGAGEPIMTMAGPPGGGPPGFGFGGGPGGGFGNGTTITPEAIAQSRTILSASQATVLQQMQQTQQAQQQLLRDVRENFGGPGAAPSRRGGG